MTAYYNEFNPHAVAWLRKLIKVGAIAPGEVDERSITDVTPSDLAGFQQCHFFAGIGGWSLALRLAGIPDDYPIWTGSCPCQPYSAAGKGKDDKDERNLWPEFFRLIKECRPIAVAGEQVAAAIRHGWLDGISADLEGAGYTVGAAVLGAHSVGAPHIRQRLYWMADSAGSEPGCRELGLLAADRCLHGAENGEELAVSAAWSDYDVIHCRDGKARRVGRGVFPLVDGIPADLGRRFPELRRLLALARSGRRGRLKGYGNAIIPSVAAAFISAWMDSTR